MFAIDHAATALLVKRRFPSAPMVPLLLSVQAMDLAWVILNYLGVERFVRTVNDRTAMRVIVLNISALSCITALPILGRCFDS